MSISEAILEINWYNFYQGYAVEKQGVILQWFKTRLLAEQFVKSQR